MAAVSAVFEYAVLRVVPRVERGECVNAGVVLHCRDHDYLAAATALDDARVLALDPGAAVADIRAVLESIASACANGAGPSAGEDIARRFRWLTAPRSTVVQPGPVHTGLTDDPAGTLGRLLITLVR